MPLVGQKKSSLKPEAMLRQICLMESLESKTSAEATATLSKWLQEGVGITQILKYYMSCQSIRALDLLCNHVREPHDKVLLDQIADHLQRSPTETIVLMSRLINNGPSWLSKIPSHDIFFRILDLIKSGKNLEYVNSALFLISSLLPYCSISDNLVKDLFRCFLDACKLYYQKNKLNMSMEKLRQTIEADDSKSQVNSPFVMSKIIYLMQIGALQSALKIFFNAFYAIYPNTVLTLLQKCVQTNGNTEFFTGVLEPILLSCRIHPNILTENRDRELSAERNKDLGPNELFTLCEKVSIAEPPVSLSRTKLPCFTLKQQSDDSNHGLQSDLNSLDASTFSFFKQGCQNFPLFVQPINQFELETSPSEPETGHYFYSQLDYFNKIDLENLLTSSLSVNSNLSSKQQPYDFNPYATDLTRLQRQTSTTNENMASSSRQQSSSISSVHDDSNKPALRLFRLPLTRSKSESNLSSASQTSKHILNPIRLPWSVAQLVKHTVKLCLEQDGFKQTKDKIEELRCNYMQEAQEYHERLKLLGLADRLPGKIYDDLHSTMKGLSVENQLVNNHLMFERSCRLLLAKRSKELSERLKAQALKDSAHERVAEENRQLRQQNNEINHLLRESQDEKNKLHAKLNEKSNFYLNKLQAANAKIDDLVTSLNSLQSRLSDAELKAQTRQKQLESILLEQEHRLVKSQVADIQKEELQQVRYELLLSQEKNQQLRDQCESLIALNKQTSNEQLNILSKNVEAQRKTLNVKLQKSRVLVDEWMHKYKQLEYNYNNEFEQRVELEASIVRAAKSYAMQLKSVNHKYDSLLAICNKQEAHIAYIYGLLKKSPGKGVPAQKLHNSSLKELFPIERLNSDEVENQTVDDQLRDLFGEGSSEKLELIDRQSDLVAVKKISSYVPSSSLDTFVPAEIRHERRYSLTTLPISEYNVNEGLKTVWKSDSDSNSTKASSKESFKAAGQTPELSYYFPF